MTDRLTDRQTDIQLTPSTITYPQKYEIHEICTFF